MALHHLLNRCKVEGVTMPAQALEATPLFVDEFENHFGAILYMEAVFKFMGKSGVPMFSSQRERTKSINADDRSKAAGVRRRRSAVHTRQTLTHKPKRQAATATSELFVSEPRTLAPLFRQIAQYFTVPSGKSWNDEVRRAKETWGSTEVPVVIPPKKLLERINERRAKAEKARRAAERRTKIGVGAAGTASLTGTVDTSHMAVSF